MTDEVGPRAPQHAARYHAGNAAAQSDGRLVSPSFARNYDAILDRLSRVWPSGTVLEIGAGTGMHAAHLARDMPGVRWLASDPDPGHLASIAAWDRAMPGLGAILTLDACLDWAGDRSLGAFLPLDGVYAQNVIHIASWRVAEGIVAGAAACLGPGGALAFYGPYREGGVHTGDGNARFDRALRAENPDWGVRDVGEVAALAARHGFGAPEVHVVPSNNRVLVFRRAGDHPVR